MSRWASDPEGAARALIDSVLHDASIAPKPVLWANAKPSGDGTPWSRRSCAQVPGTPEPPPGPFATALLRLPKSRAEQMMTAHQCLGVLAPAGHLIVYGGNDEGIRAFQKTLSEIGRVETLTTRGHGRVVQLSLEHISAPLKPRLADWRQSHTGSDGAPDWTSYPGLFAGGEPDPGTALLLAHLPAIPASASVLDYGAGPGAISARIKAMQPSARLTLLDNDSVALVAAADNVPGATLIGGDSLAAVGSHRFDLIVSNPPLHIGFRDDTGPLHRLIADAPAHLTPEGQLLMVVQRRIALDRILSQSFALVETAADDGRYRVWRATKPLQRRAASR